MNRKRLISLCAALFSLAACLFLALGFNSHNNLAAIFTDKEVFGNGTSGAGVIGYFVEFDGNGADSGSMVQQQFAFNEEKPLTANTYTRTGYSFNGWNTAANGTGTKYADKSSVKNLTQINGDTVKLYSQWTPNNYAININVFDGDSVEQYTSGAAGTFSLSYDNATWQTGLYDQPGGEFSRPYNSKLYITNIQPGTGLHLNKVVSSDITQEGPDNNGTYTFTVGTSKSRIDLQMSWNKYTVKYNANGGTGTMSDETMTYSKSAALTANTFTRTGYTFSGWATSDTGSKSYSDKESVKNLTTVNEGVVTLYAVWKPNTYTVKFDSNGGSGTMPNQSFTYDVSQKLSMNLFNYTDHQFIGWADTASGSVKYANQASVKNLISTNGETITLYARWNLAYTMLDTGSTVNTKLISLAGSASNIKSIIRTDSLNANYMYTDANIISVPESGEKVYAWYDSSLNEVKWFSADSAVYMNPDSASLFADLAAMTSVDLTGIRTNRTTKMNQMFSGDTLLSSVDMSAFDTKNASMTNMFNGCTALAEVTIGVNCTAQKYLPSPSSTYISGATGKWYNSNGDSYMPANIPTGKADVYYASTSKVPPILKPTNTWFNTSKAKASDIQIIIFQNAYTPTGVETVEWHADVDDTGAIECYVVGPALHVVNKNYSNGINNIMTSADISNMFSIFTNVTNIRGLELVNSVHAVKAENMFGDITGKGTTKLKQLKGMDNWNLANLTDAKDMFSACGVSELSLNGWNLGSLTDYASMFEGTKIAKLDIGSWDISKAKNTSSMFKNATNLNVLYLSTWKTSSIVKADSMFSGNSALETIYATDETDLSGLNVIDMFKDCTVLSGSNGTTHTERANSSTNADTSVYARIDITNHPGYFSKYTIGTGTISARLYKTTEISNTYDTLTKEGITGMPWDYTVGARLLEVKATNLKIGEENTITVTVPAGLQINKGSWTTAGGNIKSVSFNASNLNTNGAYSNSQVGTLSYTIQATSDTAYMTCFIDMDTVIWNRCANIGTLTGDNTAVLVELDSAQSVAVKKITSCRAVGGNVTTTQQQLGNSCNVWPGHPTHKLYLQDEAQYLTPGSYYLITRTNGYGPSHPVYLKSLTATMSLSSTTSSGTVYADFAKETQKILPDISTVNHVTTLKKNNYYGNGDLGSLQPYYIVKASQGFTANQVMTYKLHYTAIDYFGNKLDWDYGTAQKFTVKDKSLNWSDLSPAGYSKWTSIAAWHKDTSYVDYLGSMYYLYSGIADTDKPFHVTMQYDTSTANGSAPILLVQLMRLTLQGNISTNVSAMLMDASGKTYGPYLSAVGYGTNNTQQYLNATAIASANGLSGTYYFKSIEYDVPKLFGSLDNSSNYYDYYVNQTTSYGGFWGLAKATGKSTITLTYPDKTTKTATITTYTTSTPYDAASVQTPSFENNVTTLGPGDHTLKLQTTEISYIYGNTHVAQNPALFIRLPDGVSVTSATGPDNTATDVRVFKSVVEDGNAFNIYRITPKSLYTYGGYKIPSGNSAPISSDWKWWNIKIHVDQGIGKWTLKYQDSIFTVNDKMRNGAGGAWETSWKADKYDLNENGQTNDGVGAYPNASISFTINAPSSAKQSLFTDWDDDDKATDSTSSSSFFQLTMGSQEQSATASLLPYESLVKKLVTITKIIDIQTLVVSENAPDETNQADRYRISSDDSDAALYFYPSGTDGAYEIWTDADEILIPEDYKKYLRNYDKVKELNLEEMRKDPSEAAEALFEAYEPLKTVKIGNSTIERK